MDSLPSRLGGGGTKSRARAEASLHPRPPARPGGPSPLGPVVTAVRDQTDTEAGNGTTLTSHHPGRPQVWPGPNTISYTVMTLAMGTSCLGRVSLGRSSTMNAVTRGFLLQLCDSEWLVLWEAIRGVDVLQREWRYCTLPFRLALSSSKFIAQTRVILASWKSAVWRVSATTEITLRLVHHGDVTKHTPLFSWGVANIWVHYV